MVLAAVGTDIGITTNVSTDGITISLTPGITAGLYAVNDTVGGLLTFANAARAIGWGGVIKDMVILDDDGEDVALELWLFDQTFTAIADNAPWTVSEADMENLAGVIATANGTYYQVAAGARSAAVVEVSLRYDCVGTSLFGQLVTRGAPTYAATDDVTVKIGLLQD